MPLVTARELAAARAAPPPEPLKPQASSRAVKAELEARVRMFHPDSTDRSPISCSFELDGETVTVKYGVAVVSATLAACLESAGWRRGRELPRGD